MKRVVLPFVLLLLAALTGCAGKPGLPFHEVEQIPKDRGIVYFYMPQRNVNAWFNITADNDEGIGVPIYKLERKRYFAYEAPKGEHLFRVNKNKFVTIDVEPGESYFVRITSYMVDYVLFKKKVIKMEEIDPTAGFIEIAKTTSLINSPEERVKQVIVCIILVFMLSACASSMQKMPTRTSTTKYTVDTDCR